MTKRILSVEELLQINETMLGRGMPTQDDGIGYNKADYGICADYFYGISNAQIADLAKRLVKYSKTQLDMDRQLMKDTAEYYKSLTGEAKRQDGVSVLVGDNGTTICFRYNPVFVQAIKSQPKRQFDANNKQWIVPNTNTLQALEALRAVGADVDNAIQYIKAV